MTIDEGPYPCFLSRFRINLSAAALLRLDWIRKSRSLSSMSKGAPKPIAFPPGHDDQSSGPGEFHPQALTDPDVSVSTHPAPTVQPVPDAAIANAQIMLDPGDLSLGASAVRVDGAASSGDISTSPSVPGGGRGVLALGKVPICGNDHSR